MHIILTGATGLVGSAALARILPLLKSGEVSHLSILSRRPKIPSVQDNTRVTVVEHKDFSNYPPDVLKKLQGAEGCIWALGVSQTDVKKEEYIKITLDYAVAAAKAFSTLSNNFKFVYVSGSGATTSPSALTPFFGVIKGQCELALLNLSKEEQYSALKIYSVRPGYIDTKNDLEVVEMTRSVGRSQGAMKTFLVDRLVGPLFRLLLQNEVAPTEELGRFLVELAMSDGAALPAEPGVSGEGRIIENAGMRKILKQEK